MADLSPCDNQPDHLDAVVPITYSEHLGQMHDALRGYKDGVRQVKSYAAPRLNGILWRFASPHESCVAVEAGVDEFELVTTVPSSDPARDEQGPHLRTIVQACGPLRDRFERLLHATGKAQGREYDEARYAAQRTLSGESVLLIDDTWVRGGHAQSAAHALKGAGARAVGLVAIGRHVRPDWEVDGTPSSELLRLSRGCSTGVPAPYTGTDAAPPPRPRTTGSPDRPSPRAPLRGRARQDGGNAAGGSR